MCYFLWVFCSYFTHFVCWNRWLCCSANWNLLLLLWSSHIFCIDNILLVSSSSESQNLGCFFFKIYLMFNLKILKGFNQKSSFPAASSSVICFLQLLWCNRRSQEFGFVKVEAPPSQLQHEENSNLIRPHKPLSPLIASRIHQELHKKAADHPPEVGQTHGKPQILITLFYYSYKSCWSTSAFDRRVTHEGKINSRDFCGGDEWEQRMRINRNSSNFYLELWKLHEIINFCLLSFCGLAPKHRSSEQFYKWRF